ncbi:MAG TPA: hypothetical protein VFW71_10605 [Actinomycetota bacterium]|nr:hypothetical protein [Actinomycetota bacterium]
MDAIQRDLEDVAAAIRAELRLEAEEAEREAAVSAGMRRTLAEVAAELMAHGDTVAVEVGGQTFTGTIAGVGADLVTIDIAGTRADVALAAVGRLRVVRRARSGGTRRAPGEAPSLRARLLELQLGGALVEVGTAGPGAVGDAVTGRVTVVGPDHVALGSGPDADWFVPMTAVAYIRTVL